MKSDNMNETMENPNSLADLIGNHIGRYELSDHKKKGHAFDRKVALACGAGLALMIGGMFANEHYTQNQAEYESKLTGIIQEHVMTKMPTIPLEAYLQNNNYE